MTLFHRSVFHKAVKFSFNQRRFYVIRSNKKSDNMVIKWFYATDIPKAKPYEPSYKPLKAAEKFLPFSDHDSESLERLHQNLNAKERDANFEYSNLSVNEDNLYEVDLKTMTLQPSYWAGPNYEVRRGLWFDSTGKPLNSHLSNELESHYQTIDFENESTLRSTIKDIYNLSTHYKEGNLAMFLDENTGFLMPDISGGQMQLNYLKTSFAQTMPINAVKIVRGYNNLHSGTKKVTKASSSTAANGNSFQPTGKISDIFNFELASIFGYGGNPNGNLNSDANAENEYLRREIENDYVNNMNQNNTNENSNNRPIQNLILCVHGIGQTLGKSYEYVNFAHTINLLRANIKKVYSKNGSLREINKMNGIEDWNNNSGVQVLPITWRHDIGFDTESKQVNADFPLLPTLEEVTVKGVIPIRKFLGNVGLDILLYEDSYYKKKIAREVQERLNQTFAKFKEKNPSFNGNVHLIGHSLGTLICFDILSHQKEYKLNFDVKNMFCIGSPVGVFKLVQRIKIGESDDDSHVDYESPSCENLYNIFHVCDPIAYRMEPLVDRAMAKVEQAYLPKFQDSGIAFKVLELGGNFIKDLSSQEKTKILPLRKTVIPKHILQKLVKLNSSGRIDYSLAPNLLDVDMISAIRSHISYFEEVDLAGFILKESIIQRQSPSELEVKEFSQIHIR